MPDGDFKGYETGSKAVRREAVISARAVTVAGALVAAQLTKIGDLDLDLFDEVLIHINVTTALLATSPTLVLYFQRAVVPNPVFATDAHWDDFYALGGLNAVQEKVIQLPIYRSDASGASGATLSGGRNMGTLGSDSVKWGHWGDRIRIYEVAGGTTVTQNGIYTVNLTGIRTK